MSTEEFRDKWESAVINATANEESETVRNALRKLFMGLFDDWAEQHDNCR